jgi:hypothetical protein
MTCAPCANDQAAVKTEVQRYSLKSSNHCRAVEAVESYRANFPRRSHNQSVKLQFVARRTADFKFVVAGSSSVRSPSDFVEVSQTIFCELFSAPRPRLAGAMTQPPHLYPSVHTTAAASMKSCFKRSNFTARQRVPQEFRRQNF